MDYFWFKSCLLDFTLCVKDKTVCVKCQKFQMGSHNLTEAHKDCFGLFNIHGLFEAL